MKIAVSKRKAAKPGAKALGAKALGAKAAAAAPEKENGTVRRVLLLLSALADHPGESARQLADRMNLPRSTVHRLIAMLRDNGFADSEARGNLGPGHELYRIAGRLAAQLPYRKIVAPTLQALAEEFQETSIVALLVRERLKMYYAATGSPRDPMRYNIELGALEPLVWGATARVMLAQLTEAEIATALSRQEPSPARQLAPDAKEVRRSLAQMRSDGYGITHAHRTLNTVGVAAPFFDGEGRVVGSVGFLIPEFRWTSQRQDSVVRAVVGAAAGISRQLGHGGGQPRDAES